MDHMNQVFQFAFPSCMVLVMPCTCILFMLVELSDIYVNKFVVSHIHLTLLQMTRANTGLGQLQVLFANCKNKKSQ